MVFRPKLLAGPHKSHLMNLKRIIFSSWIFILDHDEKHHEVTERCEGEFVRKTAIFFYNTGRLQLSKTDQNVQNRHEMCLS